MGQEGVPQNSDAPAEKRPLEPVRAWARQHIDDKQQHVDRDVDDEMDQEPLIAKKLFDSFHFDNSFCSAR